MGTGTYVAVVVVPVLDRSPCRRAPTRPFNQKFGGRSSTEVTPCTPKWDTWNGTLMVGSSPTTYVPSAVSGHLWVLHLNSRSCTYLIKTKSLRTDDVQGHDHRISHSQWDHLNSFLLPSSLIPRSLLSKCRHFFSLYSLFGF